MSRRTHQASAVDKVQGPSSSGEVRGDLPHQARATRRPSSSANGRRQGSSSSPSIRSVQDAEISIRWIRTIRCSIQGAKFCLHFTSWLNPLGFMGCAGSSHVKHTPGYEDPIILAAETSFTVSEVEALYELFKKLSNSITKDGLIHKEEFQLALFRNSNRCNLFADRIFDLFDLKRNGVIEFGEFVRSLSIFHPNTAEEEKIAFAFRLYDLRCTGFIEREELHMMVMALLNESDLCLSDDVVETIVDNTFSQADSKSDGKIDPDEWREFVKLNPSLLRNMTLPYLKDITFAFPSFVMNSEVDDEVF